MTFSCDRKPALARAPGQHGRRTARACIPCIGPLGGGTQLVLAVLVLDAWLADFLPRGRPQRCPRSSPVSLGRSCVVTPVRDQRENFPGLRRRSRGRRHHRCEGHSRGRRPRTTTSRSRPPSRSPMPDSSSRRAARFGRRGWPVVNAIHEGEGRWLRSSRGVVKSTRTVLGAHYFAREVLRASRRTSGSNRRRQARASSTRTCTAERPISGPRHHVWGAGRA